MSSSDSKFVVPEISEESSVTELMTFARSTFRQEEFDEVERLLAIREEKLEMELRNLKRDYEEMKRECESLEEKTNLLEAEKLEMQEELKKRRIEYEEARQQLISLEIEKNRMIEELTGEKREAEELVALRDSQLMDLDIRVFNLEEAVARLMRIPADNIRSGAFLVEGRTAVEVPGNGVNIHVHEGQNGGTNLENFPNGVIDHAEDENGFSLERLHEELGGDYENAPTLEAFLNSRQQVACRTTGNQDPDLSIEETAANENGNVEVSSGAQSTFDCPQVESVASDPGEDDDEFPDTDSNDKELLQTNARTMNGHDVILSSCDAPLVETNGQEKGKKTPMAAALINADGGFVLENESSSQAAAPCIPVSKVPGSPIIIAISDSDEESFPGGLAVVSAFCPSEDNSIGKKMPFSNSAKSAHISRKEEENGTDGIKDSLIHLTPKRKRSMPKRKRGTTETNDSNFMGARRKTEGSRQLPHDEKSSLVNDSSMKLNLKSAGCQKPILPSVQSHLRKVGESSSLQIASVKSVFDDANDSSDSTSTDSGSESDLNSYVDKVVASLKSHKQKTWKFEADLLSDFEKDYELCMNAVCALYRKKISAEKSTMMSSVPAEPAFSYFDAMSIAQIAKLLIDGDPQLKLKRTVSDVQEKYPEIFSKCKDLAIRYADKVFEIYQKGQDPFFHPKF